MNPVEIAILETIYQSDKPVGTGELFTGIEARGFKQSEAFPLIDSLEDRGYIIFSRSVWHITKEGIELLTKN
jgi:DNA-binding MarR family transcriptional regulator